MEYALRFPRTERMCLEYDFDDCKGYPYWITYDQALKCLVTSKARFRDAESRDAVIEMFKRFDYRNLCDENIEFLTEQYEEQAREQYEEECREEKAEPSKDIAYWDEINRQIDEIRWARNG